MSRIDLPRLENAMRIIAQLIERGDDAYWPILERLEAERDDYLSRRKRLKTYLTSRPQDASRKSKPGTNTTGFSTNSRDEH